jgi:hypothetical protein
MQDQLCLKVTSPRLKGPAVRRWQELLLAAKYPLGDGADGVFGPDTEAQTIKAQQWLGVTATGVVDDATMEAMLSKLENRAVSAPEVKTQNEVEILDYRGKLSPPSRNGGVRPWSEIQGVCLHRTGGITGEKPEHWFNINAHIGVTLGGKIILLHPFDLKLYHGHNLSKATLGLEFSGNPDGIPGYKWPGGGGPHPCTPEQVSASQVLLGLLVAEFVMHGQTIKLIVAHRQSDESRESDPGWELWSKIAIPWMDFTGAMPGEPKFGYAGDTWGATGKHIPTEWDPRSNRKFWEN